MKLKWLGHASFRIKTDAGTIIYIDPYAGEYDEKADIILVSHHHHDHYGEKAVKAIKVDDTKVISTTFYSPQIGATPLVSGQTLEIKDVTIQAVPAYNIKRFRRPGVPFHPKKEGLGFLILVEKKIIYFAGDTDLIPEMGELGPVDIALLPVGGTFTMDAKEAAASMDKIKPKKFAVPMHYGVHAGSVEDAEYFKELAEKYGTEVRIMKEGEETII